MSHSVLESHFLQRQTKLAEMLMSSGIDTLALNAGPTITYLTGLHFHLSERPVVAFFRPDFSPVIVLPELEAGKLEGLPFPLGASTYGEDPHTWQTAFTEALRSIDIDKHRIGVEERRMRVLEVRLLEKAAPQADIIPAQEILAEIRMYKDAAEIENMRQAVDIAQRALIGALPVIKPGISEKEIAAELTIQLLRNGSSPEFPFSPIVASGPNSANPHATPTNRPLTNGDLLIIDWGATCDGYFSDLTRTFAIGSNLDDELKRVALIVEKANLAAQKQTSPGISASEVDQAARQIIEKAGYGQYFIHRTGHGLGMESHEEPYIRSGNELLLAEGMVFTIEPGIYLPGRGGVRIEDNVVITATGIESLSNLPRYLMFLD